MGHGMQSGGAPGPFIWPGWQAGLHGGIRSGAKGMCLCAMLGPGGEGWGVVDRLV